MTLLTTKNVIYPSLLALLLALMLPAGALSAAELSEPQIVIQKISDQLQAAIKRGLTAKEQTYDLANDIVVPHIDFRRASSLALGKHWHRAKPGQQQRFTKEFKRLLVRTYATAFYTFKEWELSHVSARTGQNNKDVFVRTKVLRPGAKPTMVEYRMYRNGSGKWKIYNLKIEGISLVTNYRNRFQREIRNGGLDGLINSMKAKNDTRTAAI